MSLPTIDYGKLTRQRGVKLVRENGYLLLSRDEWRRLERESIVEKVEALYEHVEHICQCIIDHARGGGDTSDLKEKVDLDTLDRWYLVADLILNMRYHCTLGGGESLSEYEEDVEQLAPEIAETLRRGEWKEACRWCMTLWPAGFSSVVRSVYRVGEFTDGNLRLDRVYCSALCCSHPNLIPYLSLDEWWSTVDRRALPAVSDDIQLVAQGTQIVYLSGLGQNTKVRWI